MQLDYNAIVTIIPLKYPLIFKVHVRTWQCGGVTCNCGIVAREDDDVILFDMCWDGIPRFRFLSKEEPSEGTSIKRDPSGKSFIVS